MGQRNTISRSKVVGLLLSLFLAVSIGCATSKGNTYDTSSEAEEAAAKRSAKAAEAGSSSSTPSPSQPGNPHPARPAIPTFPRPLANQQGLKPIPAPPPSYLEIVHLPRGATVFVDGLPLVFGAAFPGTSRVAVQAGHHSIEARWFGYDDIRVEMEVIAGETFTLPVAFSPADLRLRRFDVWPKSFDPSDPGSLGTSTIQIEALSPGHLTIDIEGPEAKGPLASKNMEMLSPNLTWVWNGHDGTGRRLGPGVYSIIARTKSGAELARTTVLIRPKSYARSAILVSGSGGSLFAPAARPIEAGRVESILAVLGHVAQSSGPNSGRVSAHGGVRLGIPLGNPVEEEFLNPGWEMDVSVCGVLHPGSQASPSSDSVAVTAALLVPVGSVPVHASLLAKANFGSFVSPDAGEWPSPWDGLTRFPGLSLSLPLEFDQDNLRLFLAPEIEASSFYPSYDWRRVPGFYAWGYLRGGIELTQGPVSAALSGTLRSLTFDQGLGLALPLSVGMEVRWHASELPLVLSFLGVGEFDAPSAYYLSAGLSIAFRL